ncbi:glycosyltransferase family 2 protein [Pararhodospirillum oryzae]|uniref:Glycosyl transferase n=1 Tax=Pararhodospirillum oryzae TaxID=478448 RepID=A0A512H555_9PROT|nr:glycosyltransferase family 2 protein [Pararhodospirillum oryzae]GEO80602.1 glycosyl transferase [Pararhodospirillum oryzae]
MASLPVATGAPLVSVLIPTFRRPTWLRRALLAVAAQSGPDPERVEIVVVDNDPNASAQRVLAALAPSWQGPALISVHERRPGISAARNTAVALARGPCLVFLDDDQWPEPGWLRALLETHDTSGAGIVFGPVVPHLGADETDPLRPLLARYFGRTFALEEGASLTGRGMALGLRNSLLDRRRLRLPDPPFDPDLGRTGGEDSVLIRRLIAQGARLAWSPGAVVNESVPRPRCTVTYVRRRRFRDGQAHILAGVRLGRAGLPSVILGMVAGGLQALAHALAWVIVRPLGRARAARHEVGMWAGLGKLLWGRPFRFPLYGL